MHLIVPFAGTVSEAGQQALQSLALPHLEQLLARLKPGPALGSDEFSLNTPHEQAIAQARGWGDGLASLADAALPFAAARAAELGLHAPPDKHAAWGLLTPVHLQVSSEGISLTDPDSLALDEAGSRELLEIVRPLFESEGFALHWSAPLQWLASHPLFNAMTSASLDRVIGCNVNPWLPDLRAARLIRRLQNEVQMVLYTHSVNDRREAAGLPTVNSFWLSGCGSLPAHAAALDGAAQVDDRLRGPALSEDWAAWCEAWRALDAGPVAALARDSMSARLTLCGERCALTLAHQDRPWWQALSARWRKPALHGLLGGL